MLGNVGAFFGEKAFRKELLEQMAERVGEYHYAEERQERGEQKARGIVSAELKRIGWMAEDPEASEEGRREQGAYYAVYCGRRGPEMNRGASDGCVDARIEFLVQAAAEAEVR